MHNVEIGNLDKAESAEEMTHQQNRLYFPDTSGSGAERLPSVDALAAAQICRPTFTNRLQAGAPNFDATGLLDNSG